MPEFVRELKLSLDKNINLMAGTVDIDIYSFKAGVSGVCIDN